MIKYYLKYFAILVTCFIFTTPLVAQTTEVMRKLNARYERVAEFAEGLAVVSKNKLNGYADTRGQLVVALKYDKAANFKGGRAVVRKNGKYTLIDTSGRELTPLEWDGLGPINDGVAVGWKRTGGSRTYALIDTTGNVLLLEQAICHVFCNGLAVAGAGELTSAKVVMEGISNVPDRLMFAGKYGYITPDGKWAIEPQFEDAKRFAEDGLAPVAVAGKYYPKWGYINKEGTLVIPCNYYTADHFSGDRAVVSKVVTGGELAFGYIDRDGREIIPCTYDEATSFRFKNTWVGNEQDGEMHYMLIDRDGKRMLRYTVHELQISGKYGHVACAIRGDDGSLRYGILSNEGKVVVPFIYDHITIFSEWDSTNNRWQEAGIAVKDGKNYSFDVSTEQAAAGS